MITRTEFAAIDAEIKKSIDDTLNDLRAANQNDYALFLADGEYRKEYEEIVKWLSDNKGRGLLCMGNCGSRELANIINYYNIKNTPQRLMKITFKVYLFYMIFYLEEAR